MLACWKAPEAGDEGRRRRTVYYTLNEVCPPGHGSLSSSYGKLPYVDAGEKSMGDGRDGHRIAWGLSCSSMYPISMNAISHFFGSFGLFFLTTPSSAFLSPDIG